MANVCIVAFLMYLLGCVLAYRMMLNQLNTLLLNVAGNDWTVEEVERILREHKSLALDFACWSWVAVLFWLLVGDKLSR